MPSPIVPSPSVTPTGAQSLVPQLPTAGIAPNWVQEAASAFMMQSPAALAVARQTLPKNPLLAKTSANTIAELPAYVAAKEIEAVRPAARSLAMIVSAGVALTPALIAGVRSYERTDDVGIGIMATALTAALSFFSAYGVFPEVGPPKKMLSSIVHGLGAGAAAGAVLSGFLSVLSTKSMPDVAEVMAGGEIGGAIGAVTGGAIWLYPRLALLFSGPVVAFNILMNRRQLREVIAWASDAEQQRAFFAAHPWVHAHFLSAGISSLFRVKQAAALTRMDLLQQKLCALQQAFELAERALEASDFPPDERLSRLAEVREQFWKGMERCAGPFDAEVQSVAAIESFVTAALEMSQRLQLQELNGEKINKETNPKVRALDVLEAGVDGLVDRTERKRRGDALSLEADWEQLRDMGDRVVELHEGTKEVDRLLSDGAEE